MVVLTVGHSNRSGEEFLELLRGHQVQRLVDVRTVPHSRHNPQFGAEQLAASLRGTGIAYTHMPGLGGFRKPRLDSVNGGWRNASFRGYADYMQTAEFGSQLDALIDLAAREQVAIMCSEAVPWRCHRSLIADALLVRGVEAREVASPTRTRLHTLTPFARVEGLQLTYPDLL